MDLSGRRPGIRYSLLAGKEQGTPGDAFRLVDKTRESGIAKGIEGPRIDLDTAEFFVDVSVEGHGEEEAFRVGWRHGFAQDQFGFDVTAA